MQVNNHPYLSIFGLSRSSGNLRAPASETAGHSAPVAAGDQVEVSPEAQKLAAAEEEGSGLGGKKQLSEEEQQQVEKLKARDREVRAHEQAHKAAAGGYATSGPTYEYQSGPDGKRYAVGGEVGIDTSPVSGDPEATIRKAQVIRRAALAPAEPSSQDQRVAAQAARMEAEARQELSKQRMEESQGGAGTSNQDDGPGAAGGPQEAAAGSQGGLSRASSVGGYSGFDRGGTEVAGQLFNLVA